MTRPIVGFFESLSIVGVLLALVSGMFLGSGVSTPARSIFIILAGISFLLSAAAMILDKRWRILWSPLWMALFGIIGLAAVQVFPAIMGADPTTGGPGSTDRHATIQSLIWGGAAVVVAFIVTSQVRTFNRLCVVTSVISLTLWGVGLIGFGQTLAGRPQLLGFISPDDPELPAVVRDIYSADSAYGLVAYGPWDQTNSSDTALFLPRPAAYRFFGGFLDARHWAACVVVLFPMILASCLYLGNFAGVGGWRTHGETMLSRLWWVVGLCMIGTAAWMGDPVIVPTIATLSLAVFVLFVGRDEQKQTLLYCYAYLAVMAGVCGAYLFVVGTPPFFSRLQTWLSDGSSFVEMFRDHWLFGTGLGATSEVWPMYRWHSAAMPSEASSLLAAATEAGLIGVALMLLAGLYVLSRAALVYRTLDGDGRLALAGSLSSMSGLILFSLMGPGLDLPVVVGLAVFSFACLMRSLAGGYRDEEAMLPV